MTGEDLSNPFTLAHPIEQDIYKGLYYSHYRGLFAQVNAPALKDIPGAFDAHGRPLWFDGAVGGTALENLVAGLLSREQIDDLDHLLDDWNNPSERLADGRWKLVMFDRALAGQIAIIADRNKAYQHIRQWREKKPTSRTAAFVEALYWYGYAWDARGSGYANSVTPEGWQLFEQRLKKAEAVLIESESYASSNPLWGNIYLRVGNSLNWSKPKLLEFLHDQVSKNRDFEPFYFSTVNYLVPKWGGSWELIDAFVKDAVTETRDSRGNIMYALIYWKLAQDLDLQANLYSTTAANWAEMKQGFKDLIALYPHSAFNFNRFAAAACEAGDKETFQSLRFRIGKVVTPEAWPSNYSLDLCEHKFATQPL